MAIAVLFVYIAVVVDKVPIARVIRRIDIDDINLPLVRIGKGGEGFEVVALYEDVVWRIRIVGDNGTVRHLFQHRQLLAQSLLHVFRLVFPHKAIRLVLGKEFKQLASLLIGQHVQ